jgi:hypothetical protein
VEYARGNEPAGFSFVTKASSPLLYVVSKAKGVVGKSPELVRPVR